MLYSSRIIPLALYWLLEYSLYNYCIYNLFISFIHFPSNALISNLTLVQKIKKAGRKEENERNNHWLPNLTSSLHHLLFCGLCYVILLYSDTIKRESRVILLVGPQTAGKSSLIDFLCNYFYGAELEKTTRYHIANEVSTNFEEILLKCLLS